MADAPEPRSGFRHQPGPLGGGCDLSESTEGLKPGTPEHDQRVRSWLNFEHQNRYCSGEMQAHHNACVAHLKETIETPSDADRLIEEMAHVDDPEPGMLGKQTSWMFQGGVYYGASDVDLSGFTVHVDTTPLLVTDRAGDVIGSRLMPPRMDLEEALSGVSVTFDMTDVDYDRLAEMFSAFGED